MSVVVIDPVSSGITYLDAAQRLGVDLYVFSADEGERQLNEKLRDKARKIVKVDTSNFEELLSELNKLENISAVLPGVEYAVPMAARLGAAIGKKCLSDQAVALVRNKFNFRSRLTDVGLSSIGFSLISPAQQIQIPVNFNFPAVVKPVDMAGSINVCKVHNQEELTRVVEDFYAQQPNDVGFTTCGQLIIEEYIPGKEYSIEGVVRRDGSVTLASITEKLLGAEPYFVEIGHVVGQHYADDFRSMMNNYALAVIEATQLNIGPFHLELRVTPSGIPVAVEMAARLPGDNIVALIKSSSGVDLAMETICEYVDSNSPTVSDKNVISAIAFIPRGEKNEFTHLQGINQLIEHPNYISHQIYYKSGDKLSSCQDWTARVGYVMFAGSNENNIKGLIRQVHEKVKIA